MNELNRHDTSRKRGRRTFLTEACASLLQLRRDYSRCCTDNQPRHGFLLTAILSLVRLGGVSEARSFGMSEGPGTLERTMLQTGFTTGSDLLRNLRTGESFRLICAAEAG